MSPFVKSHEKENLGLFTRMHLSNVSAEWDFFGYRWEILWHINWMIFALKIARYGLMQHFGTFYVTHVVIVCDSAICIEREKKRKSTWL